MGRKSEVKEVRHNDSLGNLDDFYDKNEKLIHSICQRWVNTMKRVNLDYDDVFQIATIGFMKAYENFDPEYGWAFTTYAVPKMQGEIQRYVRDFGAGGINVSRGVKEIYNKIRKDDNFDKNVEELAELYETTKEMVKKAIEWRNANVRSIEETIFSGKDGEDITLADQIGENEDTSSIYVQEFLDILPDREREICYMVMSGAYNQSQIGEKLGVSQVQVSRIIRDKIGPLLKKYLSGEQIEVKKEMEKMSKRGRPSKGVPGRPKKTEKEDFSYLDKKELSKLTTRQLLLEGFEPKEIVYIKDTKPQAVYAMRSKMKSEERQKEAEKEEVQEPVVETPVIKHIPFDEPIIDISEEDLDMADKLLESSVLLENLPIIEEKEVLPLQPNFDLAKKMLTDNPDTDRVFLAEETGLTPKQVSDLRWRIKTKGTGEKPAKAVKKLEFNLHASSGSANKKEVMTEFARIMETITAIGADSMSYYISIQSPAEESKE